MLYLPTLALLTLVEYSVGCAPGKVLQRFTSSDDLGPYEMRVTENCKLCDEETPAIAIRGNPLSDSFRPPTVRGCALRLIACDSSSSSVQVNDHIHEGRSIRLVCSPDGENWLFLDEDDRLNVTVSTLECIQ